MRKSVRKKGFGKTQLIVCIVFFAALVILPAATVIMPKESFSQVENKSLEPMPEFSFSELINGNYTDKLEKYLSQHFVGRTSWIKLKSKFEYACGKREQNGIYILNDRLIEKVGEPVYSDVDKNINAINNFADNLNIPVYMLLAPTSAEFYKNELPSYEPELDQNGFIDYVYGKMNDKIENVDVYQTLSQNKDSYIYYRTDHHWTSRGAFLAYTAAGKKLGYTPVPYSQCDVEHAGFDFLGTFYSKTLCDKVKSDTVDIFHPNGEADCKLSVTSDFNSEPVFHDGMYYREFLSVKDKYSVFFGTNQPLIKINTGKGGKRLLVIKDSYAHSFVPFLTMHYSEIDMLDMRYVQLGLDKVVNLDNYDEVLILYNVSSFSTDSNLRKLAD